MTEPKFTDEDLGRLKERIQFVGMPDSEEIPRLLARLEAGEAIIRKIEQAKLHQNCELRASDLYIEDWRKASGQ